MISIIGAGRVGSISALNILRMGITDVTLIDIIDKVPQGEALDLLQASSAIGFDGRVNGSTNFADIAGSDLVIVTAGAARKPGISRLDLTHTNAKIVSSIIEKIVEYTPRCKIMVVTNPVDIMTFLAYKKSGFERNRVFGMGGLLDTLRYRSYISTELNVSRKDIHGLVIGEHGDGMIPLVDHTTISGIPIKELLSKEKIENIVQKTRTGGMDVISLKGSTIYAPTSAIAIMSDAIINSRNKVLAASVVPNGEYSLKDIAIGLPIILGKNGVEKIIELEFNNATRKKLLDAASTIKSAIARINSNPG